MKKIFLIIACAVLTTALFSQLPKGANVTDENGLKQGEWIYWTTEESQFTEDSSESFYYRVVNYKDDKIFGTVKGYLKNGDIAFEAEMKSVFPDIWHGKATEYHENGSVYTKARFYDNKKVGKAEYWLEDGSYDSARVFMGLGVDLLKQDKLEFSIKNYLDAYRIYRERDGEDCKELVSVTGNLGLAYYYNHDFKNAEKFQKISIEKRLKLYGDSSREYGVALNNLALVYNSTGREDEAIDLIKKSLEIKKAVPDKNVVEYLTGMRNLASMLSTNGRYTEADSLYDIVEALTLKEFGNDNEEFAEFLIKKANHLKRTGKLKEADSLFTTGLEMFKKYKGAANQQYLNGMESHAQVYLMMQEYDKAIEKLSEVKKALTEQFGENHPVLYTYYNSMGVLYSDMRQYQKSIDCYQKAMEIVEKSYGNKNPQYLRITSNLVQNYVMLDRYTEAQELLDQLKKYYESSGKKDEKYASFLNTQAVLHQHKGEYTKAEPLLKEAIMITIDIYGNNNRFSLAALNNLASLYSTLGRYDESEKYYQEAVKIYESNDKLRKNYATVLMNYSELLIKQEKYDKAMELSKKASDIFKNEFSEDTITFLITLNDQGSIYFREKNYDKALEIYKRILVTKEKETYENKKDYAFYLRNYGISMLAMNDKKDGLKHILDAGSILKDFYGDKHKYYIVLQNDMAKAHRLNSMNDKAYENYNDVLRGTFYFVDELFPGMTENEKMLFWNTMKNRIEFFYSFGADYYKENNDVLKDMYNAALATKGMILEEKKKTLQRARGMSRVLTKWQAAREYWIKLVQNPALAKRMNINVDSVKQAANDLEKQMTSVSADFEAVFDTNKVRWQDVKKVLKEDEAAIEIIRFRTGALDFTDTVFYAALILKGKNNSPIEIVVLENGNDLEGGYFDRYTKEIISQRDNVSDNDKNINIMKKLYDVYWKKIDKKLEGINNIYVSPEGVYNKINLNSLISSKSGKYLIDETNIILITGVNDLVYSKRKKAPAALNVENRIELFGNPDFQSADDEKVLAASDNSINSPFEKEELSRIYRGGISPLPGTKVEIDKIAAEFKKIEWKANILSNKDASEDNLKKVKSPKVLHLATHGVFLEDVETNESIFGVEKKQYVQNPLLRSMLLFSGAGKSIAGLNPDIDPDRNIDINDNNMWAEDGILTAYETINLDLDGTELVVLSACKTGLGEIKNGEGVYGLQRAFQTAGAKNVIMSLWTVNDKTTQELMVSFYKHWLSGIDKKEAFKKAQTEIKSKYTLPYYWAGFIMVGE